jgi:hypothetical protein
MRTPYQNARRKRVKDLHAQEMERKDKERLNWLESQLKGSFLDLCHFEHQSQLDGSAFLQYDPTKPFYVGGSYGPCGATLREAIDAAIAEQTKQQEAK